MKRILFIIVLSFLAIDVFSQDLTEKIATKREIRLQHKDIMRQYSELSQVPPADSVIVFNLCTAYYDDTISLSKAFVETGEILNYIHRGDDWSFIKKLCFWLKNRRLKEPWPRRFREYALIMTSDGSLIAVFDGSMIRKHNGGFQSEMAKYISAKGITFVFTLRRDIYNTIMNHFCFFGVDRQGGFHVFHYDRFIVPYSMKMCPIEEFPDEKWRHLFYTSRNKALKKEYGASEKGKADKR
ncbi:hypothetical protein [Bacteroides heparinolyticus]|uniref:hypothetical protein n=1 Tax=Prevotella heparinolytica TaxID=28113 RepID=UPI0035A13424